MLFTKFANIATLYLLPHASVINNLPEHIDSVNCNNCNKIIIIFYNNVNAHLYMGWGGGVEVWGVWVGTYRKHDPIPPYHHHHHHTRKCTHLNFKLLFY